MREKLEIYHKKLNHKDNVPNTAYRRNDIDYPLVCYVNNIIGVYLSSNFDIIPIFIDRAYEYISVRSEKNEDKPYYQLILEYLAVMTEFILTQETVAEEVKGLIPKQLLQGN